MILAVPAIGVLKILLPHSDHLKPFVILLEDKAPVKENEPDLFQISSRKKSSSRLKRKAQKAKA